MRFTVNPLRRTWMTLGTAAVLLVVTACSNGQASSTAPSSVTSLAARPSATSNQGTTAVTFPGFDINTLALTIATATTASAGDIDGGKIHLLMLVDAAGNALPCGSSGGSWERIDGQGGGVVITGGATSTAVDLDNLNAVNGNVQNVVCGATICIRAQYITGGGSNKVDTHVSNDAPYTVTCGCSARSQGYWKNHPSAWPVTSLTLGTVSYTQAELLAIFDNPVQGNGLVSLAHQLIAAKLNLANGASGISLGTAIADADALIGSLVVPPVGGGTLPTSVTSPLVEILDAFNTACEATSSL